MKVTRHDIEQRSPEWRELRRGRLTSSRAHEVGNYRNDGQESNYRRNLRVKLAVERITEQVVEEDDWSSRAMQRGKELEPLAIAAYEAATGQLVEPCGLVTSNDVMAAASPDGVIGDFDGLVEVKCPLLATHYEYLKAQAIPSNYQWQIRHLLWVTGAEWCSFFSWHPSFPPELQSVHILVTRDDAPLDEYEEAALKFLGEVDVEEKLVRKMAYGKAAA